MKSGIDNGLVTILIIFDFTRAFPSIVHEILFQKMRLYGFLKSIIRWFRSFLLDPSQCVRVGESRSSGRPVHRRVPQGSPLASLCFSFYINDLPPVIQHSRYHLYADESQICIQFLPQEISQTIKRLNADINRISEWAVARGLKFNPGKTQMILLGGQKLIFKIHSDSLDSVPLLLTR